VPDGTLAGLIASRTYTGQHVEYVVEVGKQRLLARMPVETTAEQHAAVGATLDTGEKAAVRFNPGRTVLIREAAG
jgi:NADPH:quinone reductase-like Zn-dependent oxidoreductase